MSVTYLVDTNTLSELGKRSPDARALRRLEAQAGRLGTASICWQELRFGMERLDPSRRRDELGEILDELERTVPVLPFDKSAAEWLASERARLERQGQLVPIADGHIASVAGTRGLVLVTRNVRDFGYFRGLTVESWHR